MAQCPPKTPLTALSINTITQNIIYKISLCTVHGAWYAVHGTWWRFGHPTILYYNETKEAETRLGGSCNTRVTKTPMMMLLR